jgi:hypothetical protein
MFHNYVKETKLQACNEDAVRRAVVRRLNDITAKTKKKFVTFCLPQTTLERKV